jgi:hypothetical protein
LHQIGTWTAPAQLQKSILNSIPGDAGVSELPTTLSTETAGSQLENEPESFVAEPIECQTPRLCTHSPKRRSVSSSKPEKQTKACYITGRPELTKPKATWGDPASSEELPQARSVRCGGDSQRVGSWRAVVRRPEICCSVTPLRCEDVRDPRLRRLEHVVRRDCPGIELNFPYSAADLLPVQLDHVPRNEREHQYVEMIMSAKRRRVWISAECRGFVVAVTHSVIQTP